MDFQIIPIAEANVTTLMNSIEKVIINPLIIFVFALALVYFVYGIAQYLLSPGNEEIRKTSKQHMLWGVIGMFIMIATFGIMNLILNTLGEKNIELNNSGQIEIKDNISGLK